MVSLRQYEPPSPLASAEEEGGRAGERGGGLTPDLAFTANAAYQLEPEFFFHIIGEIVVSYHQKLRSSSLARWRASYSC